MINRRNGTIIFHFPNFTSHKYECFRRGFGEGNGNLFQHSWLENSMEKEPGGLQSIRSQRVGHNWATNTHRRGLIGFRLKKKEKPSLTNLNKFRFYKISQNILSTNAHCEPPRKGYHVQFSPKVFVLVFLWDLPLPNRVYKTGC